MNFYIKVANSKTGARYCALVVERSGIERVVTFDIEAILLITGMTLVALRGLPLGMHNIEI